jgi:hypothetical protein
MPFTPIHMGPGMLLKSALRGHFSLMMFGWSQIVIDLQPLLVMLTERGHLHGATHTYLGALLIAPIAALSGKHLAEFFLRRWQLSAQTPIPWSIAITSALIGTVSHVFLDSIMHADLHPFAPLTHANPMLSLISISALHWACLVAGVIGLIAFGAIELKRHLSSR